jgi:streptogramin lyase
MRPTDTRRLSRASVALLTTLLALLPPAPDAHAVEITVFPLPNPSSSPWDIVAGLDGNLWFTEFDGDRIGRITPDGDITEYPLREGSEPIGITRGPDGNLWFTESGTDRIGRITPAGVITEFPLPVRGSHPWDIVTGPDGNLWFTEYIGNRVGRMTTSGSIKEFTLPNPQSGPTGIIGFEGSTTVWFTEHDGDRIGRITPPGVLDEFELPEGSAPYYITVAHDATLWFTEHGRHAIGRATPFGGITDEYPLPSFGGPVGIISGPGSNANLWFTELLGDRLGQITLSGDVHEFPSTPESHPAGIALGPGGTTIWYAEYTGNSVVRIEA